ncbi:MAG: transposase [Planctomycetota bacterium]
MLDVEYRHLVFTLPQQLRHLIRANRRVLVNALYRAGARTVLSLTAGLPTPKPGKNRRRIARKARRFVPGIMIVCHTFVSDLGFNPHLHVLVTAGGLSLDRKSWVDAPPRSFGRIQDLVREQFEHQPLACPLCREPMIFYGTLFGPPEVIAHIADIEATARLPPGCYLPHSRLMHHSRAG